MKLVDAQLPYQYTSLDLTRINVGSSHLILRAATNGVGMPNFRH